MSKMKMGALYREEELKNELRPDVMLKPGERYTFIVNTVLG